MARRRGFFAELQHQQRLAEARANAARRAQTAASAQMQRARAAQERAEARFARASEAERKQFEREMKDAHIAARVAEVDELNENLAEEYGEIDGLLASTLRVDDFVDLEALKKSVVRAPFARMELKTPRPAPAPIAIPEQPRLREPEAPTGLFGKKKKLEEAQQQAQAEFQSALRQWEDYRAGIPAREAERKRQHAALERTRMDMLEAEQERYDSAMIRQKEEVAEHNAAIDALVVGLGYGATDAVQEYVGIVLANSIYPDSFDVEHDAVFDPETAELRLQVTVPAPDTLRTVKSFRYVKANDEIAETQLSKKDANDRYAGALHQVALRSLHEIFEADRRGLIQAISLQVGPDAKDPATGRDRFMPLIAVTAPRDKFLEFDLSSVVPSATLQHLGAAVSKTPAALTVVDVAGVRGL
jgi:restriction system protein